MFPSRCRILRAGQKDEPTFVFLWGKIPCVSPSPLPLLDVPGRPRQYRSQQKYERLLGAGLHVFDRRGYYQATVDAIAAEAKVSTGTFYRFFRDKRQLLLVLVGEQLDL